MSRALENFGPGNILRDVARVTDRSKIQALETGKTQLAEQVAAMTQELTQKSEEIRKYQSEQGVVLSRIRELVGHREEVVNKAQLYDQLMKSADPSSAQQSLQILVKYSRSMKDLLKEIQKLLPPCGIPMRVLNPGPLGLPTATLYEVIEELELTPTIGVGPNQPAGAPRPQESGRPLDPNKTHVLERTCSSQVRRKSTSHSARSGQGPSPGQATPELLSGPRHQKKP